MKIMRPVFLFSALTLWAFGVCWLFSTEAPHDLAFEVECESCHMPHNVLGNPLTSAATNALVCQQCHNALSNFPMLETSNIAVPGRVGTTHRWNMESTNATYGATPPSDAEMNLRLNGTKIVCSTCHDQHETNNWGTQYLSAVSQVADPSVDGPLASGVNFTANASAATKAYLIDVVGAGNDVNATYRLSNDNGRTWFGWSSPNWVVYAANPRTMQGATDQNLNDAANVQVNFVDGGGAYEAGDQYRFYVSYPFMRMDNANSAMCENCHTGRVQSAADQQSWDGSIKSHPVGETLSASYDRAEPLDVDGDAQSISTDTNATNDLILYSTEVRCMTCHGMHYTDSNATSVDR